MSRKSALIAGVYLAVLASACVIEEPASSLSPAATTTATSVPVPAGAVEALVIRVPDGDSLVVEVNGVEERLRIIGINAPESDECLGPESRDALQALVSDRVVWIAADEELTDQYDRLLRYVWVDDIFVNQEQVEHGLAIARGFPPNEMLQTTLDDAEDRAIAGELGIWNPTACGGTAAPDVEISFVVANPAGRDDENLNEEYVVLANPTAQDIDLSNWILRDSSTVHRFTFPEGSMLLANDGLVVRSGCGDNRDKEFFWCSEGPIWDNGGDEAFLLTPTGAIAATLEYDEQR